MKSPTFRLAAVTALTAIFAFSLTVASEAQVQVQPRAGSLAPQQKDDPDGGVIPTNPKPAGPAAPAGGGFKAAPTACLTGWSQVELKHDSFGHLSRMTCSSPIIECPDPGSGYTVGLEVAKQNVNPDDGRFRIQYRCVYYRIQG